jgi:hypothetical protein
MWSPGAGALLGAPVSLSHDDDMADATVRELVRELRARGINCISVTETGAGRSRRGTALKLWLDVEDSPVASPVSDSRVPVAEGDGLRRSMTPRGIPPAVRAAKSPGQKIASR